MIEILKRGKEKHRGRKRLSFTQIKDKELDKRVVNRLSLRVLRLPESSKHDFAIVGTEYCLLHDMTNASDWRYYQLPKAVKDGIVEHNNTRLWFVATDGKLAALDLRSGEWSEYEHEMSYSAVLYAGEDGIVALCADMFAIDAVRLQDGHVTRITNVPIDVHGFSIKNSILGGFFFAEQERFFLLVGSLGVNYEHNFTLLSYDRELQAKKILSAPGNRAALCSPFVVVLSKNRYELIYADLRREPVEQKHLALNIKPEWEQLEWTLSGAFVFGDDLIVSLVAVSPKIGALVRVGTQPEVLYSNADHWPVLKHLGPFLVSKEGFVYDLAHRTVVSNMPHSALLRGVIQYEAEQSKLYRVNPKPLLSLMQATESSASDTFKVFLKESPTSITETENENFHFSGSISSTKGDVAFSIGGSLYLLPRDKSRFLSPLPQPNNGWQNLAIDEQGRFWLCDRDGQYISIISLNEGGTSGQGIALNKPPRVESGESGVKQISVFGNRLLMVGWDDWIMIYHYDGKSLKKIFELDGETNTEIISVQPNAQRGGWWVTKWHRDTKTSVLNHLDNTGQLWKVEQIPYQIEVIGDWVEQVYFVYIDNAYQLYYMRNPYDGWQQVLLQDALGEEYVRRVQHERYLIPVALHSLKDQLYFLIEEFSLESNLPMTSFFMSVASDKVRLISAFHNSTCLARWGEWLILYSKYMKNPMVLASGYEDRAETTMIPPDKNLLFYHPPTGQFSEVPYAPYSVTGALRSITTRKFKNFLKML